MSWAGAGDASSRANKTAVKTTECPCRMVVGSLCGLSHIVLLNPSATYGFEVTLGECQGLGFLSGWDPRCLCGKTDAL